MFLRVGLQDVKKTAWMSWNLKGPKDLLVTAWMKLEVVFDPFFRISLVGIWCVLRRQSQDMASTQLGQWRHMTSILLLLYGYDE